MLDVFIQFKVSNAVNIFKLVIIIDIDIFPVWYHFNNLQGVFWITYSKV